MVDLNVDLTGVVVTVGLLGGIGALLVWGDDLLGFGGEKIAEAGEAAGDIAFEIQKGSGETAAGIQAAAGDVGAWFTMDPTGRVVASSLPPLAPLVHTREGREALGRTGGAINQALGDLGGATNQALGDVGHTLNPATYL